MTHSILEKEIENSTTFKDILLHKSKDTINKFKILIKQAKVKPKVNY
jgi:hypothetical protein